MDVTYEKLPKGLTRYLPQRVWLGWRLVLHEPADRLRKPIREPDTTCRRANLPVEFILETRGLTKEFKGFIAVNNVDLKVQRGHIHARPQSSGQR